MHTSQNAYGQAIGPSMSGWSERPKPAAIDLNGTHCRLEPLSVARHAGQLFQAYAAAPDDSDWTYLSFGPFADLDAYSQHLERSIHAEDRQHYAVIDLATGKALGSTGLIRITPQHGVLEVGVITYSRALMRKTAATEAMYLLLQYAFDTLGYRRVEWKCDHLNARSRAAALRYGFSFEGIFRQSMIYKGRSRDTIWFALLDGEWAAIRKGYQDWLAADNFDAEGRQRQALGDLIDSARQA